jgi:hypothetical protein
MNRSALLFILPIFFVACQSKPSKPVNVGKPTQRDTVKLVTKKPEILDITGIYYAVALDGQSESCDMSVEIKKDGSGYLYEISLNGEKTRGKATLQKGDDKQTYINFEGIKWAEYEGDISNDPEKGDTTSLELPVGIDGVIAGDEITIQNAGNAMNYYVKFAGCDEKYIRLVKNQL